MNGKTNFDFIILFGLDWFGPFGLKFVYSVGFILLELYWRGPPSLLALELWMVRVMPNVELGMVVGEPLMSGEGEYLLLFFMTRLLTKI